MPIVLWYLISVVQWSNAPINTPDISIPLIVRGVEAFSVFIVASLLIYISYRSGRKIKAYILRIIIVVGLYLFSLLASILSIIIRELIGFASPDIDRYFFIQSLHFYFPLLLTLVVHALVRNRFDLLEERESKLKTENLSQQAKWMMLRYQVNPHFLFNALNTIRALIGHDDKQARKIVTEMSEYFRYSLSVEKKMLVPISEEMNAVMNYLEIQKIRFKDKLIVKNSVNSMVSDFLIPVFTIQTLVENAVKYGLKTSEDSLKVEIDVFPQNDMLLIVVRNSGKIYYHDDARSSDEGTQTGIENLKERLYYLDPDFKFKLYEEEGMVVARVLLKIVRVPDETVENVNS